ncbi:MAG: hypothetical protein Q7J66_25145 [Hydrogenophaga sp.]|nr:hypothetical protein [Hydrogenophaga sp.]
MNYEPGQDLIRQAGYWLLAIGSMFRRNRRNTLKHTNSKIASASRHYEVHASGLLDMQRHGMSSQTFDWSLCRFDRSVRGIPIRAAH